MGCCITTIFLVFGSRVAILAWWLLDQPLFILAFKNWALPGSFTLPVWVWPLLGTIFFCRGRPWHISFSSQEVLWVSNGVCWELPFCSIWPGMVAVTAIAIVSRIFEEARQQNKRLSRETSGLGNLS